MLAICSPELTKKDVKYKNSLSCFVPSQASDELSASWVSVNLRITRALYAQLTFHNVQVPTKLHVVQKHLEINTKEERQAFDLGIFPSITITTYAHTMMI